MGDTADPVDSDKVGTQDVEQERSDKPEGEDKARESDGEKNDEAEESPEKAHRGKTLEQMMSLKEGDDERTQISKKISWILRHGARKVSVEIDVEGWVNISDILALPVMAGVTEEKLMDIIDESNQQKVRYELKDADGDRGRAIRAVAKHTVSGLTSTVAREQRRLEREQRREQRQDFKEAAARGEVPRDAEQDDSRPVSRIVDGPTYEQQLQDGYRPIYQANRVVAMVKDGPDGVPLTVQPGRRTRPEYKGDFKGNFKGDYKGKGDFKGYGDSKGYGKDFRRDMDSYSYGFDRSGYGGYDGGKGDEYRDYKGSKSSKDGGKGYRDEKGYRDRGDSRRDYGRYSGKGYDSQGVSNGRVRWRVCPGQEAVVRARFEMESEAITKLFAGTLVYQTGDCIPNEYGIMRMPMETEDGVCGWVTRTAEAANGPAFFRREEHEKGRRGYDGEKGSGKTYDGGFGYGKDSGFGNGKGKAQRGGKTGSKGGCWEVSKGSKGRFENGHFSMGSGY